MKGCSIEIDGPDLFTAADVWRRNADKHALDDLFQNARLYRSSDSYRELMTFVSRFRFYSPFNAMLIYTQMPGAKYVAPARRWADRYGRRVKEGARPIVILQPMGPVMFVFDVAHTDATSSARPLPPEVERPFEVRHGRITGELATASENAKRDGIEVCETPAGSQHAGSIQGVPAGNNLEFQKRKRPPEFVRVPLRYRVLLNSDHSPEVRYATLSHELGHLYCGHVGSPNEKWWPNRLGMDVNTREFEAESVCYLICARLGIENPSDEYLAGYLKKNGEIPPISLDCVLKSAGLIEQMARESLPLR